MNEEEYRKALTKQIQTECLKYLYDENQQYEDMGDFITEAEDKKGYFIYELFAGGDQLETAEIEAILQDRKTPQKAFENYLRNGWQGCKDEKRTDLIAVASDYVTKACSGQGEKSPLLDSAHIEENLIVDKWGDKHLSGPARGILVDYIDEHVDFAPDFEHYRDQPVNALIFLDTGDSERSNVFVYGEEYGRRYTASAREIDRKSALYQLAKWQGYTANAVADKLYEYEDSRGKNMKRGFLKDLAEQSFNTKCRYPRVCMCVDMTLGELIDINELMRTTKGKGAVVLKAGCPCGLQTETNGDNPGYCGMKTESDVHVPVIYMEKCVPAEAANNKAMMPYGPYPYAVNAEFYKHGGEVVAINPQETPQTPDGMGGAGGAGGCSGIYKTKDNPYRNNKNSGKNRGDDDGASR